MSKTYTVEMTLGQVMSLVETLKAVHGESDYYTERALTETPAELAGNSYVLNDAERNTAKRAKVAALITMITSEPYGDPTEAVRLADVRKAVDAHIEAEKALADAF